MTNAFHDPLLLVAKAILAFFIGMLGLVTGLLALGAVSVPLFRHRITAELVADGKAALTMNDAVLAGATLLLLAIIVGLLVYFLIQLWRIVKSVGEGDPFIPANAQRLSRMGWALVAFHIAGVFATVLLQELASFFDETDISNDADLSDGGTLLLMLVVFILARVFRHGAAMREDLEGTV